MKRKIKSLIAMMVAIIMIVVSVPAQVFAADNPFLETVGFAHFDVSTSFCAHGEKTKIFVDISADSQMSAALFTLKFDTSMLKATVIDVGVVLKNGYTSANITENGIVKVAYADTNPSYEAGRLFEVEFEAIGEVPDSDTYIDIPVVLEVTELRNYEDYSIASEVTDGKITLIERAYGDVDLSGSVSASDALMTLYDSSKLIELTEEQKTLADVNGDGKVSVSDALQILQYSAGSISNYTIFQLPKPVGVSVMDKDENTMSILWEETPNVLGYNIFVNGEKVNDAIIKTAGYSLVNLTQDTKYDIEIQAVNALMESAKSDKLSVSTNKAERMVTFKNYDGTILDTQIVLSGEAAHPPVVPERKGYSFTGWDTDINCITTDVVITALFEINTYKVNFDYLYNGVQSSQSYTYNTCIEAPSLISRPDYTLEGWYCDKNFIKKWDFAVDLVKGDTTLYAKWVTWSEWTTDTSLADNPDYSVESKTQYSYRDKSTTTSTSSSMSGWTQDGSYVTYGSWTNAGWTKSKPAETSTLKITDTKAVTDQAAYNVYTFYRWKYWNTSAGRWYYTYGSGMGGEYQSAEVTGGFTYYNTYDGYAAYLISGKDNIWFGYSTKTIPAVKHTEWYYQTRTATTNYNYYKWSDWSSWSDSSYSTSNTREVKNRTVYRYKLVQK